MKYEKIKRALGLDDDDASEKEETALLSGGFQKFKGRCYGCDKFGHKSQLCPDKDKDGNAARKNSVPPRTVCNYCKKEGHWKRECPELAKKKKSKDSAHSAKEEDDYDVVLASTEFENNPYCVLIDDTEDKEEEDDRVFLETEPVTFGMIEKDLWLGDSGASSHMTNSLIGMTDVEDATGSVRFGNSQVLKVTKIGKKAGTVVQKDGKKVKVVLAQVKYVPGLYCNLMSLTQLMAKYFVLTGTKECLKLVKGKTTIVFDRKVKSGKGVIFGVRITDGKTESQEKTPQKEKLRVSKDKLHNLFGHASLSKTLATGKKFGYSVTKPVGFKCKDCSLAKQRQKI